MDTDQEIYRTFEEFEREELRRAEAGESLSARDWDGCFGEELDFGSSKRSPGLWDEDE